MFMATTHSPDKEITKEKAIEDFMYLLGRSSEYFSELEKLGKVKEGSYVSLYESLKNDARIAIEENWDD